jgi:hypothetical protein
MQFQKIEVLGRIKARGNMNGKGMGDFDPDQSEKTKLLKISTFDLI